MLRKKRIGLFVLLLATGLMSVGEASGERGAEVPAAGPKQAACNTLGCPDETSLNCAQTTIGVRICYEPERK